ncbi:MAG TPA: IS110 family transposase [Massilibacterium sp.]|nr:IS110 family transposase [Massilibacterium sp.]
MIFVGIDIAKMKHQVAIIDIDGKVLKDNLIISNKRKDFEYLHSILDDLVKVEGDSCEIALERTGHYSDAIFNYLKHEKNYHVKAYNPLIIKEFSKSQSLRKTKTDKTDALLIAKKLRSDSNVEKNQYNFDDSYYSRLKSMTRHRSTLTQELSKSKTRYTKLLDQVFPELSVQGQLRYSNYVMDLLELFPTTHKITSLTVEDLYRAIDSNKRAYSLRLIHQLAKQSIGEQTGIYSFELKNTIKSIRFYTQLIKETDKEIKELMDERPSPILTIPGISYRLASVILAEYGDVRKFNNPGQMLAFAGLEPSINQSGDFNAKGKMVKRGSTHLRWALGQAAENVVRYSHTFKLYYLKKRNEGKHYNVVISHCAKKLIRVIFSLLNNNLSFIDG